MFSKNRSLVLLLAVIFCLPGPAFCQLKKYTLPELSSFASHSAAVGRDSLYCFTHSNGDGDLALYSMKNGCCTYEVIKKSGNVFRTAAAFDNSGKIHICYTVLDLSNWPETDLYYINNVAGTWSDPRFLLHSISGIQCLDLAVDAFDHLHLGLMRGKAATSGHMLYLSNSSGSWQSSAVGDSLKAYDYCSMALDKNGFVHFAFYGFTPYLGPGYITNAPSGTWQTPEEIHPDWRGGQMEGSSLSITTDSESKPHLAYSGDTKTDPSSTYYEHQQYAWKTTTSWEHKKIDDCNFQGAPSHIIIDNNNKPRIIYSNTVTNKMIMARDSSGTWVKRTLSTPAVHGKITYQKTTGNEYYLWDDWSGELTLLTDFQFPAINVNKERLDFGDLTPGKDSIQYLIIKNIGDINLSICDIINSGKDKGDFIINVNKYLVVPGDSCIIRVTFKPLSPGTKSSNLFIHSNSLDPAVSCIPLSGKCTPVYTQWAAVIGSKWHDMNAVTISCSDGNYLTVSSIQFQNDTSVYLQIIKTDHSSKVVWNRMFHYRRIDKPLIKEVFDNSGNSTGFIICGDADITKSFFDTIHNNYFSDTFNVYVFIRINKTGDVLWSKYYNPWYSCITSVEQTPEGGFIIGGQVDWMVNFALKLDSLGIVQWAKEYSSYALSISHQCYIHNLPSDSGFIILGQLGYRNHEVNEDLWIAKTDKLGNIDWQKQYGTITEHASSHPRGITELLDKDGKIEGYIASFFRDGSRKLNLVKLDIEGNTLWSKEYSCSETLRPSSLIQYNDSSIVLSAEIIDSTNFKKSFLLFEINKFGNIQWKAAYSGFNFEDYLIQLDKCLDNGFIISGITASFDRRTMDIVNIKTDSLGRIQGCMLYYEPEITVRDFTDPYLIDESPNLHYILPDPGLITRDLTISESSVDCSVNEICGYFKLPDTDQDGIHDAEEGGPESNNAGYDGNKDGIPDYNQANAASFHNAKGDYVTISSPSGTSLCNVNALPNPESFNSPENAQFIYDFFGFIVDDIEPGGSIVIDLFLPQDANPEGYYKYGMLQDSISKSWYKFMYNDTTGAVIDGNKVSLYFTDGLRGDDDISKNGVILDVGGPAIFISPDISCSTDTLQFSTLNPGENETKNVIIKNLGERTLVIDSAGIAGADSLLFELILPENLQLLPGESYSMPVTFSPVTTGDKTGYISIFSNDHNKGTQRIEIIASCDNETGTELVTDPDEEMFSVHPNPAGDYLVLAMNEKYEGVLVSYEILDLQGRILISGRFENVRRINTQFISSGIYLVRIEINGKLYKRPVIINR
jgi:hypothetical protein